MPNGAQRKRYSNRIGFSFRPQSRVRRKCFDPVRQNLFALDMLRISSILAPHSGKGGTEDQQEE